MSTGPRNDFIARRQAELLAAKTLPPTPPIKEFREPPSAREYVRRYELWEMLGWYEHNVARPNRGIGGFFRRLWRRVRGKKIELMSPWEQLHLRDMYRAREQALEEAPKE